MDRSASVCLHSVWTMIFISSIVARLCVCVFWDIKLSPHKDAVIILNSVSDSGVTVCRNFSFSPLLYSTAHCLLLMPALLSFARSCSLYWPFHTFTFAKLKASEVGWRNFFFIGGSEKQPFHRFQIFLRGDETKWFHVLRLDKNSYFLV